MARIDINTHAHRALHRFAALGMIGIASVTLATATAHAQPIGNGDAPQGCPVEDEHGNVTYVPVGTRIGLFHCGSDGEWHFGWLTDDMVRSPSSVSTTGAGLTTAATSGRHVTVATTR
jgi:hypothetical protein